MGQRAVIKAPEDDFVFVGESGHVGEDDNVSVVCQKDALTIHLNGKKHVIPHCQVDPLMTLNEWIRTHAQLTGTKLGCGEGGCGACAVLIVDKDGERTVNSCLRPLCTMDGASVTTTEFLGSKRKGFHPVQETIAKGNGTQCGFCTPGMVMNMFGLLRSNPNATKEDIEKSLDGNLCRCTGYRPILQSFRSFAKDGDETGKPQDEDDKNIACFGDNEPELALRNRLLDVTGEVLVPPGAIATEPRPLHYEMNNYHWYRPVTVDQLQDVLDKHRGEKIKLVAANTSVGIYKEEGQTVFVDIRELPDMKEIVVQDDGNIVFGAAATLTNFIDTLEAEYAKSQNSRAGQARHKVAHYPEVVAHIKRIANRHVRNAGSLAGNLVMCKTRGFASDLFVVLWACRANLHVLTCDGIKEMSMANFLALDWERDDGQNLLLKLDFPPFAENEYYRSYKISLRPQNAHALVNAAFRVRFDSASRDAVEDCCFVYGAIQDHPVEATATQMMLLGSKWNRNSLHLALESLSKEVAVKSDLSKRKYRESLIQTLFYKTFIALVPTGLDPSLDSAAHRYRRPLSTAKQSYKGDPSEYPVSKDLNKLEGHIQASGETKYTDDLPSLNNTLYAAFVISDVANARVASIDPNVALSAPGVVDFVTAKDITGVNDVGFEAKTEALFATDRVVYLGQPLGLVLANSQRHANEAAKLVRVEYEDIEKPIVTIQQAIEKDSFHPITDMPWKIERGDVDEAMKKAEHVVSGEFTMGEQSHFYMECQAAMAAEDEDGVMIVHSSTQDPTGVQNRVAGALGVGARDVQVKLKRLGGGFGGKLTRAYIPAAAVAVASRKVGRPVRLALDRNTDTTLVGGRHPILASYKVGFDSEGIIDAVSFKAYLGGGAMPDLGAETVGVEYNMSIDSCYYFENFRTEGYLCKTNLPPNTACRAPGHLQAALVVEEAIEHVAATVGKCAEQIREMNFYRKDKMVTPWGQEVTHWTIPKLWSDLKEQVDVKNAVENVNKFNKENRWRKRGLSLTPVKYGIGWPQASALVNIYWQDGSVVISHGGVEMGQGMHTKCWQAAALTLGCSLDKIRVAETSTEKNNNTPMTGGSSGSGVNTAAVKIACEKLAKRLEPFRAQLKESNNGEEPKWEDVVAAAGAAQVCLTEVGWFTCPDDMKHGSSPLTYHNYGVGATEVEVDVLTGEATVVRADIVYDCGISLNPAIDIGQAEGAFVMGLGYLMREEHIWTDDGRKLSNGTWEYKPPFAEDIPVQFNVTFLKDSPFPKGVLRSKASGEPPLILAASCYAALKRAVKAAREANGVNEWFTLNTPVTLDTIQQACGTNANDLTF